MESLFLLIVEIVGTIAFAISGIRLAAAKKFDWFGAYTVGLVTAIGGGTVRDLLLGATPFWMVNGVVSGCNRIGIGDCDSAKTLSCEAQQDIFCVRHHRTCAVCGNRNTKNA